MDDSAKDRYYMILGRYLFTYLWLNIKFSDYDIEVDDGYFKVPTATMIGLGTYECRDLNIGNITPEGSFRNAYAEEIHKQ